MENEKRITAMNTGVKYGLYLGILSCLLTMIVHYGGFQDFQNPMSSSNLLITGIQWALVLGLIYMGIHYYRENNEGLLTFGEGLSTAMFIGLFSGVILGLFMYIFSKFIAPDMLDSVTDFLDTEEMSEEEAEAAENFVGMFTSPTFLAFSAFINRIFGALIFGMIASAILKRGD